MAVIVTLAFVGLVVWMLLGRNEKPHELEPHIWVADPEERARRLADAMTAWREGRTYRPPATGGSGGLGLAGLNGGVAARREERCCPMHNAR